MAQRYGGKFSPSGQPADKAAPPRAPFDGKRPGRVGLRANLLFVLPLPLILKAFASQPVVMAQYLVAVGLLLASGWMTREGLHAQDAYDARRVARRPALPRKIIGSVLAALGLGMAGLAGHGPIEAVIFALLGGGLHLAAFGPDPMKSKGIEGIDTFQQDRVARAVEDAEKRLREMQDAIRRANDRRLDDRVERFAATVRDMFRTVENDPRDLTAARQYLSVYLMGARDATIRFADLTASGHAGDARADYLALLDDLEQDFAARTTSFLRDDRHDLDIEINVLRDRLAREGIASK